MQPGDIHNSIDLMVHIQDVGFLPLLDLGIGGWSAEEMGDEETRYIVFPDGGWEWPLWEWKGIVIQETGCAYGKFYNGKAGFISKEWWPDFCNWRRFKHPAPDYGSVEGIILQTLCEGGSMITRELRAACGFDGPKMRSKFDSYLTKLQMAGRIVTEDFVYPVDKHGRKYGWGWSLLTTPERFFGRNSCQIDRTPQESFARLTAHFKQILPTTPDKKISTLLG